MPTYVYECSACTNVFEIEQRIVEDPLTDCSCGGKDSMKRIIQPAGVMFIGSGFHINDYSSSGSGESVPAESKEAASSSDTASD